MSDLSRDELLITLIEECGEVIQAATKCLRFGWDRDWPLYGVNHHKLAAELGEVMAIVAELPLDREQMTSAGAAKINRMKRWKENANG
jgi:hypothetical protein